MTMKAMTSVEGRREIAHKVSSTATDFASQLSRVLDQLAQDPLAPMEQVREAAHVSEQALAQQLSIAQCVTSLGKLWAFFLICIALLPLLVVLLITKNWNHMVIFATYFPALVLIVYGVVAKSDVMPIKDLLVRFGFGYVVMFTLGFMAAQMVLLLGFLVFAIININISEIDGLVVYSIIIVLCLAFTEEALKIMQCGNFFPFSAMRKPACYVLVNIFVACGFTTAVGVVECLVLVAVVSRYTVMTTNHSIALACVTAFFSIPMHLVSTYHISMFTARTKALGENVSKVSFLLVPVMLRSLFGYALYFGPFFVPHTEEMKRLLICTVAPFGCFMINVMVAKLYERHMPRSYLLSTGYLSFCGVCKLPPENEEGGAGTGDKVEPTGDTVELHPREDEPAPEAVV